MDKYSRADQPELPEVWRLRYRESSASEAGKTFRQSVAHPRPRGLRRETMVSVVTTRAQQDGRPLAIDVQLLAGLP